MEIWVVYGLLDDFFGPHGVFSTKEKAEEYIKSKKFPSAYTKRLFKLDSK